MTVKELHEIVKDFKKEFSSFKSNDFYHLDRKVEWVFRLLISNLVLLATGLLYLILDK